MDYSKYEQCRTCQRFVNPNNIRFATCFECAEAESIIEDGTDFSDRKLANSSMEKLSALISLGWRYAGEN